MLTETEPLEILELRTRLKSAQNLLNSELVVWATLVVVLKFFTPYNALAWGVFAAGVAIAIPLIVRWIRAVVALQGRTRAQPRQATRAWSDYPLAQQAMAVLLVVVVLLVGVAYLVIRVRLTTSH